VVNQNRRSGSVRQATPASTTGRRSGAAAAKSANGSPRANGAGGAKAQTGAPRANGAKTQNGRSRPGTAVRAPAATGGGSLARPSGAVSQAAATPPWLPLTALVLSAAGFGVSIYLTIAHLTSSSILVCSNKGFIDCAAVTSSAESKVFGIFPVAELGLAFYLLMVLMNTPWAWRTTWNWLPRWSGLATDRWRSELPRLAWWVRLGGVVVGILFVLYLLYTELVTLRQICLWCTSVHVVTFLLFVLIVVQATYWGSPPRAADAIADAAGGGPRQAQ
jgi:uncharacterized membrane protein